MYLMKPVVVYLKGMGILIIFFLGILGSSQAAYENRSLDNILQAYVGPDDPGMVLYLESGNKSFSAASGLGTIASETPVKASDRFRIGSATKPFVATIVLQLTQEGKIDLDAPIGNYLPPEMTSRIRNTDTATVRQTLQMTSGIPDYMTDEFDEAVEKDPYYPWTAEEVVAFSYDIPPENNPGEEFVYCNNNYVLLQILVEEVTGHSLADELQTRIFHPAGMSSCFLEDPGYIGEGIVRGYIDEDGRFQDVTRYNDGLGLGDGGIVGNASDIAKFLPALMNGVLLPTEMLDEMQKTVSDGEGGKYGLGLDVIDTSRGAYIGHDGASGGFQSFMYYQPEARTNVVILTNNFDSEIIEDVFEDVLYGL